MKEQETLSAVLELLRCVARRRVERGWLLTEYRPTATELVVAKVANKRVHFSLCEFCADIPQRNETVERRDVTLPNSSELPRKTAPQAEPTKRFGET